jgi:hypothetical protein
VAGWTRGWGSEKKNSIYWKSVNRSAPFAARVYEFLLKYEVLHPYEPYILELIGGR